MRVLLMAVAAVSLLGALAGCSGGSGDEGEVSKAPPQSVGNAGAPSQIGGSASPTATK